MPADLLQATLSIAFLVVCILVGEIAVRASRDARRHSTGKRM